MVRGRTKVAIVVLQVGAAVGAWLYFPRPAETPTEVAHRICEDCGLGADEIDGMIANWRQSPLSRDEALKAFRVETLTEL